MKQTGARAAAIDIRALPDIIEPRAGQDGRPGGHGCADALRAVLEKTAPAPEDTLVFLGDLFDRGPDSWEVFRTVRQLAEDRGNRFVLLRGNHEDYLLQPKLSLYQRMIWDRVGRGETEKSFRAHGARMEDAVPWVREHCVPFWRGEGFQCVHAGLLVDPPEVNDAQTMFHDHEAALRNTYSGPLTIVAGGAGLVRRRRGDRGNAALRGMADAAGAGNDLH